MRLVHFSDAHLGFRQFDRVTPTGINQREADVGQTFTRLIDQVIALRPDLIVIPGDVFHQARPTNSAVVHAFLQFKRLVDALPGAIVVMVAGNHDLSRTSDTGGILPLFAPLGIHVIDRAPKQLYFADRNLSVLGVPDAPGMLRPTFTPDPRARFNVLCIHGEAEGAKQVAGGHRASLSEISSEEINAPAWTYCAFGHYHQYEQLAPNAYYSGSIDFTSSNPWSERAAKGFIERDLATGAHTFHELTPSRRYIDLPSIDAAGLAPGDVDARIQETLDAHEIDGQVARLVVANITREVGHALDHRALRLAKRRAMNFSLELRRPEREARSPIASSYAELRARSLPDILVERLGRRPAVADVDGARLQAMALKYLEQAGEHDTNRAVSEPAAIATLELPPQRKAS